MPDPLYRLTAVLLAAFLASGACAPEPSAGTAQKAPGATPAVRPIHARITFSWQRGTKRRLVLPIDVAFDAPRGQGGAPSYDPLHDGTRVFKADLLPGERATLDAHQAEPGPMSCLGQVVDDAGHMAVSVSHDSVPDGGGRFITCSVANNSNAA